MRNMLTSQDLAPFAHGKYFIFIVENDKRAWWRAERGKDGTVKKSKCSDSWSISSYLA